MASRGFWAEFWMRRKGLPYRSPKGLRSIGEWGTLEAGKGNRDKEKPR